MVGTRGGEGGNQVIRCARKGQAFAFEPFLRRVGMQFLLPRGDWPAHGASIHCHNHGIVGSCACPLKGSGACTQLPSRAEGELDSVLSVPLETVDDQFIVAGLARNRDDAIVTHPPNDDLRSRNIRGIDWFR